MSLKYLLAKPLNLEILCLYLVIQSLWKPMNLYPELLVPVKLPEVWEPVAPPALTLWIS